MSRVGGAAVNCARSPGRGRHDDRPKRLVQGLLAHGACVERWDTHARVHGGAQAAVTTVSGNAHGAAAQAEDARLCGRQEASLRVVVAAASATAPTGRDSAIAANLGVEHSQSPWPWQRRRRRRGRAELLAPGGPPLQIPRAIGAKSGRRRRVGDMRAARVVHRARYGACPCPNWGCLAHHRGRRSFERADGRSHADR